MKIEKLVEPRKDVVTLKMEEFPLVTQNWLKTFEARFSVEKDPFGEVWYYQWLFSVLFTT